MKRLGFSIVLVLILSCLFVTPVLAQTSMPLTIDEIGLEICVPDGLFFTTQSVTEEHFHAELYPNYTADSLSDYLKENGIFLDCMPADTAYDIQLTMVESEKTAQVFDLGLYDPETLECICEGISEIYRQSRYKVTNTRYITLSNALFIRFDMVGKMKTDYSCCQYFTVFNGKEISLTLYYPGKEIPNDVYSIFDEIFNSLVFDKKMMPNGEYSAEPLVPESVGDVISKSLKSMALPAIMVVAFFATIVIYRHLLVSGKIHKWKKKFRDMQAEKLQ